MWNILDNVTGSTDRTREYNHSDINGGFPAGDIVVRKLTFAEGFILEVPNGRENFSSRLWRFK